MDEMKKRLAARNVQEVVKMRTGSQRPRIELISEYSFSPAEDAVELAALAGLRLDHWQKHVLMGFWNIREDGKWAASTVGLVLP